MTCPDENRLLQFVDHALSPDERGTVASHLDGCSNCRAVIAGLVPSAADLTQRKAPVPDLPQALLRDYLRRDAPAREATAVTIAMVVQVIAVGLALAVHTQVTDGKAEALTWMTIPLFVAPLPLQVLMWRALRGGWYRPWASYVNMFVETTFPMLVLLMIGTQAGAASAIGAPVLMVWSAAVVFSALRSAPAVSIAAGAIAAVESLLVYAYFHPRLEPALASLVPFGPSGAGLRAIFLLLSGVAGAALASRQVRRAEQALHAVRMQDLMGKYVVHERIGKGGMGEVFRATYCPEGGFAKTVAVKRVLARSEGDARFVQAFREEARLGASLAHPNIVQVLDFGRFEESWVLALEYVEGLSLDALVLRGHPLPLPAVIWLGAELCRGLDYIHQKRGAEGQTLGLVHRDLNPPNVLLSSIGEVKLGDFGVATALDRSGGTFAGKEHWAAPEQLAGAQLDGRSDLYALGLTLAAALAAGERGAGRLRGLERADCPARLRALITALLEHDKDRRPATAREVLGRLEGIDESLRGREQLAQAVRHARTSELTPLAAQPLTEETREMRGRTS